MEEEKRLYPFKFCSLQDEYPWGTEEFQVADLGYRDSLVREGWLAGNSLSEVMDTYLDRVVGDDVYAWYGRQFPVCVRRLRVHGRMPLRVHPDDETAAQRYDFLGKEKIWYVLRAGKDARVMAGFRCDTDAAAFYAGCLDGSVEGLLNMIAPHAGQCLHIPSGTPHAAAGDMEILEIGEASPMDFCLCGWGEEVHPDEFDTALTLVDALDFIDYRKYSQPFARSETTQGSLRGSAPSINGAEPFASERLVDLPQLRVGRIRLNAPLAIAHEASAPFLLYSCVKGAAEIQLPLAGGRTLNFALGCGETLLVPSECTELRLLPTDRDTVLLETTVVRDDPDPYINPDAAPSLPEDQSL